MPPAKPLAPPRGARRRPELHRHATKIQAVFRGWRARRRVVWDVRAKVDAFVAGVQQDLLVKQMLLGVSAAASPVSDVHWLFGGARERHLHLPRICDSVFGVHVAFPAPISLLHVDSDENHDAVVSIAQELQHDAVSESDDVAVAKGLETTARHEQDERVGCAEEMHMATPDDDGTCPDVAAESMPLDDAPGLDDAEAVEPRQLDPREPEEASARDESVAAAGGSASGLTVAAILATHSKEEILLELEWARQALRERRKYLQARRERSS